MDETIILGTCYCYCDNFQWCGDYLFDDNAEHFCKACNKSVYVKYAEEKDIKCPLGKTYKMN